MSPRISFNHRRLSSSRAAARRRTRQLTLQCLEQRQLLAVYIVDTLIDESDSNYAVGDLSFREAIQLANAGGTDTIQFASSLTGGTIEMSGYPLADFQIDDDTAIVGPGAARLTIDGQGHQMFEVRSPGITISGLTITGGSSAGGGAINVVPGAELLLENSVLTGNAATSSSGGAIAVFQGKLTVVNCTISNNSAFESGGGIHFLNGVDPDAANPQLWIINSTISGNSARMDGGGVNIYNDVARIINTTITGNRADVADSGVCHGGGIYTFSADALVTLDNTIVANNTNFPGSVPDDIYTRANPLVSTSSHNLIGNADTAGGLTDGVNGNLVGNAGVGTINSSLVLSPTLANNGGPTPTHALTIGSPAIDAGNNTLPVGMGLGRDQRRVPFVRIFDGDESGVSTVDIGAYEWQDRFKVDTLADESDENYNAGDLSLREALHVAEANPGDGEEIAFDTSLAGGILTLNGSEINVSTRVQIVGLGADSLTVSGKHASRVFRITRNGVVISGLTISGGNPGSGEGGGGVEVDHADATLYAVHVTNNEAAIGGGVYVSEGSLNLLASTISGNEADFYGGGIGHNGHDPYDSSNPTLRVIDCTISGNEAGDDGGGIYITDGGARLVQTTVTGNRANNDQDADGVGGGLWTYPDAVTASTLFNTIIAGNERGQNGGGFVADDIGGENAEAASSHNLIGNATTAGGLTNGASGNIVGNAGSGTIDLSSVLNTTLKDNGGPVPTHALAEGSPALDAADNALALDHEENPLLVDGRGFARRVDADHDSVGIADIGAFEVQPPQLVLSGVVTYTENAGPVRLAPNATLSDADNATFSGGVLQIQVTTNAQAGDRLRIRNVGTGEYQIGVSGTTITYGGMPVASFSGGDGAGALVVQLGLSSLPAATQAILRNVTFQTLGDAPSTLPRTVTFALADGLGGSSAIRTKTVSVAAVNDAPVLNISLNPTLNAMVEDAANPNGTLVSNFAAAGITDPDAGAVKGIAVSSANNFGGTWQYSLNGTNWLNFGAVSRGAVRLLPANGTARVRLIPTVNFNGTSNIWFFAWDQTQGTAGGTANLNPAGTTGGTTAFSSAADSASLNVTPVNDAPVLNTGVAVNLNPVAEDTTNPAGTLVSSLVAGVTDVDAGALKGIAVSSANNFAGSWQYSLNGTIWLNFGAVSRGAVRLLPANGTARVRLLPNTNFNGTASLWFFAWDQTSGTPGGTANLNPVGTTGGTTAFSTAVRQAFLSVTPVNDPPVLGGISGTIGYTRNDPAVVLAPGATVTDVDSANFGGGQLRVRIAQGGGNNNTLAIGTGFTVDANNNVWFGETNIGKRLSDGIGTNELKIQFYAAATKDLVQQLVRSITYRNVGGSAGTRTIAFTVSDGDSGLSGECFKTVNVS